MELAAATDDPAERAARCTFVVVGAGYTGTEVAAQGTCFTRRLLRRAASRRWRDQPIRWLLLDLAPGCCPSCDRACRDRRPGAARARGRGPHRHVGRRGDDGTASRLTDGEFVPTRTLVWCVGVRPDPLVDGLGLATEKGRLVVDEYLHVPGHPDVFACGDAAAVPDLTRPGEITAMTAQHAQRQGKLAGAQRRRLARARRERSRTGTTTSDSSSTSAACKAAANPLHVPLSGLARPRPSPAATT